MLLEDQFGSRMATLSDRVARVQARHTLLGEREVSLTEELEHLETDLKVLDKVSELFKHLVERHVNAYADNFSALVTEGLQAIYHDQDVAFDIVVGQKRGKVDVSFLTSQAGRDGDPLQSFGGGVASVESLLLRILVLLKTGMARYLFLDESLAALSVEYVDTCGEFLRKLCERFDVNVLLVTHNDGFLEHATVAYKGRMGSNGRLKLDRIKDGHAH